jgi:hypothetical protein
MYEDLVMKSRTAICMCVLQQLTKSAIFHFEYVPYLEVEIWISASKYCHFLLFRKRMEETAVIQGVWKVRAFLWRPISAPDDC